MNFEVVILSCNLAVEVVKERLFEVLPILDGQQEQVGLGQSDHVVESAHARTGHVADQQRRAAEHRLVNRVAHGILNAAVFVLKRRYGTTVFVVVVLILRINRYTFKIKQISVNRIEYFD